jgi:hypothetical protein
MDCLISQKQLGRWNPQLRMGMGGGQNDRQKNQSMGRGSD